MISKMIVDVSIFRRFCSPCIYVSFLFAPIYVIALFACDEQRMCIFLYYYSFQKQSSEKRERNGPIFRMLPSDKEDVLIV